MRYQVGVAFCALLLPVAGGAATDLKAEVATCLNLSGNAEIAKCVRGAAKKVEDEEYAALQKEQAKAAAEAGNPKYYLRDTWASVSEFTGYGLGDKGASLSFQRKNGDEATVAKGAVFALFPALALGQFQPFAGIAWSRDTTGTTKKDSRDLTVGSVGVWQPEEGRGTEILTLLHTLQFTHRSDIYGKGGGNIARAHFDFNWPYLSNGRELWNFSVLPHAAMLWHDRTGGGKDQGLWRSAYIGLTVTKPVEVGGQHLKASLLVRKLHDFHVPAGNLERRDRYTNLSIDWFFNGAVQNDAAFQPSIFLTREVGADFLTGVDRTNKTTVGVRFKFN